MGRGQHGLLQRMTRDRKSTSKENKKNEQLKHIGDGRRHYQHRTGVRLTQPQGKLPLFVALAQLGHLERRPCWPTESELPARRGYSLHLPVQ